MEFVIDEFSDGGDRILAAQGELDLHTAPQFSGALLAIVEPDASVIADLTAVTFIDSTGAAVFVHALERAREVGATLAVVAPHPRVRKVFQITGLDALLPVHDSLASARRG